MAQEPSDDDVSNLCAIADISEAQYGKVVLNALRVRLKPWLRPKSLPFPDASHRIAATIRIRS